MIGKMKSSIYFLAMCGLLFGCISRESEPRELVAKINNDNIRWEGNYIGLEVVGVGEAERRVLQAGSACRPSLIAALQDDTRFVAAHVLLTKMRGGPFPISGAEWNHLKVILRHDGTVEIPPGQKAPILRLWAPEGKTSHQASR